MKRKISIILPAAAATIAIAGYLGASLYLEETLSHHFATGSSLHFSGVTYKVTSSHFGLFHGKATGYLEVGQTKIPLQQSFHNKLLFGEAFSVKTQIDKSSAFYDKLMKSKEIVFQDKKEPLLLRTDVGYFGSVKNQLTLSAGSVSVPQKPWEFSWGSVEISLRKNGDQQKSTLSLDGAKLMDRDTGATYAVQKIRQTSTMKPYDQQAIDKEGTSISGLQIQGFSISSIDARSTVKASPKVFAAIRGATFSQLLSLVSENPISYHLQSATIRLPNGGLLQAKGTLQLDGHISYTPGIFHGVQAAFTITANQKLTDAFGTWVATQGGKLPALPKNGKKFTKLLLQNPAFSPNGKQISLYITLNQNGLLVNGHALQSTILYTLAMFGYLESNQ